jgi:murein DD-endopeptidase MepM/ murein hydrolase activator NlpD
MFNTPNPTQMPLSVTTPLPNDSGQISEVVVQAGDTLSGIASANGVTVEAIIQLNGIENPDLLSVGQVLLLPAPPQQLTDNTPILSDNRLIPSPESETFNLEAFIDAQPGYITQAADIVDQRLALGMTIQETLTAAQVIRRVGQEFSIDPRILLTLLEYQSGWLTTATLTPEQIQYPMGMVDENRIGLYKQLSWAADRLNRAYYAQKYASAPILAFTGGERVQISSTLNAASAAIAYVSSQNSPYSSWSAAMADQRFSTLYRGSFGDPLPLPIALTPVPAQPILTLPFTSGETWFYTGGPHGGWGNGSAWAAIDFAPPDAREAGDPACYLSEYPVRAVADGLIVRSQRGSVILDLDGDGLESTGWTILYLHLAEQGRIATNTPVETGDVVGYSACEGGFSTATHLHIARRYNAEWVPADCPACTADSPPPAFTLSDWRVFGFSGQEYQGLITRNGEERQAEQGRLTPINRVSW